MFSIPDIIFVLSVLDYLFGFNFISSSFHSKQYKYMQFAHLFLLFVYFLLFLSLLYVVTLLQFLVNMFFLSRIFTLLYNAGSDFSSKLTIVIVILNDRRTRNMTCWYVNCVAEKNRKNCLFPWQQKSRVGNSLFCSKSLFLKSNQERFTLVTL